MDTLDENNPITITNSDETISVIFSDDTKLADLSVGQFKQLLAELLVQTPPVNAMSAPADNNSQVVTPAAAPEPPRKLSLDELFLDENSAPQSPATETGSDS